MCPFIFLRWAEPNLPWELSTCTCPMSLNPELRNLQKKRQHGHAMRQLKVPAHQAGCFASVLRKFIAKLPFQCSADINTLFS